MLASTLRIPREKLILVDPRPLSFSTRSKPCATIDYPTARDLVKSPRGEKVTNGKCILLLIDTDPGFVCYDIEAVHLLRPAFLLLSYEANFGSSSYAMHAWLRSMNHTGKDPYTNQMVARPERWFPADKYGTRFKATEDMGADNYGKCMAVVLLLERTAAAVSGTIVVPNFDAFEKEHKTSVDDQTGMALLLELFRGLNNTRKLNNQ